MFNQEMELVYESFENKDSYNNVLTAIALQTNPVVVK